jgi:murein DD-endopeptidase MepM/ murein hydrolase activator NlpD
LIAGKESGGNYEAMYPSTTMPGMTKMTITQVINKASGAVGKYQQLPRFLAERARRAGLDPDKDLFSPANQDKIILEVNIKGNRQGDDWLAGKITDEQFMQGLSQEFASMPNAQGKFHYPGQSSAMTPGQVMDALRRVKNVPKAPVGRPAGSVSSSDLTPTPSSITGAGETNGGMVSGFPITSPYGPRVHPVTGEVGKLHGGIDVGTPTGTPLALNAPGEILAAGNYGGYGFMQDVWIPSHNIQIRLAHLSEFVKRSGQFAAGEVISKTGGAAGTPGAGSSSGPHLHFEADTRKNSGAYGGSGNPAAYAKLIALGQGKASTPTDDKGGVAPVNKEKNLSPVGGVSKQPSIIPIPMPVPQAQPMPVQVSVPVPDPRASKHKSYGINPFSGRYEVL